MKDSQVKILKEECSRGSSLLRALHSISVYGTKITGRTIDLGSKDGLASYYRYLDLEGAQIVKSDRNYIKNDFDFDLEKPLPMEDSSFNNVLLMNVLEHIYNHNNLISEIHRILRCGGHLHGFVPFFHPYHADPDDYFRYTHTGLFKILESAGFQDVRIERVGRGRIVCLMHLLTSRVSIPVRLRYLLFRFALWRSAWKASNDEDSNYYAGLKFTATKRTTC